MLLLARQKPRRLHALLSKRGHQASPQRIYRFYREEGLMVLPRAFSFKIHAKSVPDLLKNPRPAHATPGLIPEAFS